MKYATTSSHVWIRTSIPGISLRFGNNGTTAEVMMDERVGLPERRVDVQRAETITAQGDPAEKRLAEGSRRGP